MRPRSILGLSASLMIAACAHQASEPANALAWSLQENPGEGLKLTYGQAQTDNVLVMMTCEAASGQVELAVATAAPETANIELRSARQEIAVAGPAWPTPMVGVQMVSDTADARAPALARFARTGDLTVRAEGRNVRAPARGGDQAMVADFFAQCGRAV